MLVHFKAPPWWQQAKMAYTFSFGQAWCHGGVKMRSVGLQICVRYHLNTMMGATRFWNKKNDLLFIGQPQRYVYI
jgi:hypothetical protein